MVDEIRKAAASTSRIVTKYRRTDGLHETEVDGEYFLVVNETGDIFHLNAMASGIWRLLDEPATEEDMRSVLKQAFPEVDDGRLAEDLSRTLGDMLGGGLLRIIE